MRIFHKLKNAVPWHGTPCRSGAVSRESTPTPGESSDERERESRLLAPAKQTTKKSVPPISGGKSI
eukprot:scaffold36589_cov66-Skeletonema_marinoi.AAC.1